MKQHTDPTMAAMAQLQADLDAISPNLPVEERNALVAQAKARANEIKADMEAQIKAAKDAKIAEIRALRATQQQLERSAQKAQALLDGIPANLAKQAGNLLTAINDQIGLTAKHLADLGAAEQAQ